MWTKDRAPVEGAGGRTQARAEDPLMVAPGRRSWHRPSHLIPGIGGERLLEPGPNGLELRDCGCQRAVALCILQWRGNLSGRPSSVLPGRKGTFQHAAARNIGDWSWGGILGSGRPGPSLTGRAKLGGIMGDGRASSGGGQLAGAVRFARCHRQVVHLPIGGEALRVQSPTRSGLRPSISRRCTLPGRPRRLHPESTAPQTGR